MVEEVGEQELRDELSKGKLQEFGGVKNEREYGLGWCPGCPYIEFRARACTKRRFSRPRGHEPEGPR